MHNCSTDVTLTLVINRVGNRPTLTGRYSAHVTLQFLKQVLTITTKHTQWTQWAQVIKVLVLHCRSKAGDKQWRHFISEQKWMNELTTH